VAEVVDDVALLPETALQYEGEQVFVEKVLGPATDAVERRPVRLGIINGAHVQILAGVDAGDEVRLK
jgi:multidrug efflux pump subunit AcrA (membrane-fusion protein)